MKTFNGAGVRVFTYEEVKDILMSVFEYYSIEESDKFREEYLSNFQDAPPSERVMEAIERDIESFIF